MKLEFKYDNTSENTCEFWINNFQFEIFYDLTKHFDVSPNIVQESIEPLDYLEPENAGANSRLGINDLPTEILSCVFSYLTAIDLLVVQEVCPRWHDVVEADKSLWNHVLFSAAELDVKTTASLLKEMPLLRSVYLCNVHTPEDMTFLTSTLCDACWELQQIHFPECCDWHLSTQDLHQLSYFHPRIKSLQLCTKQKLSPTEMSNLGEVLSGFPNLTHLKLVGFYWHQPELFPEILAKIDRLNSLSLPSLPGLTGAEFKKLPLLQPELKSLTINTSSLTGTNLSQFKFDKLVDLKVVDSSVFASEKLMALSKLPCLTSLNINLSSSKKDSVLHCFGTPRPALRDLTVSNCEFSNDLLACLPQCCPNLRTLSWSNPKDAAGEVTDGGILAITRLSLLRALEIKSRSVSKAYYPDLAAMRSLKYARINGMRVPGCL